MPSRVLFDRYRVPVYRAALALTGDQAHRRRCSWTPSGAPTRTARRLRTDVSPLPWLHKVALNLCYCASAAAACRASPSPRSSPSASSTAARGPTRAPSGPSCARSSARASPACPRSTSAVVILYYLEGRSLQETADALGLPLGTVKSRIHHALRDLRGRLNADRRFGGAWSEKAPPESVEARGTRPVDRARVAPAGGIAPALIDFVDRRRARPADGRRARPPRRAARAASDDMTELALTIAALRRAGRELAAVARAGRRRRARRAARPAPERLVVAPAARAACSPVRRSPRSWSCRDPRRRPRAAAGAGLWTQPIRAPAAAWRSAESRLAARPDDRLVAARRDACRRATPTA